MAKKQPASSNHQLDLIERELAHLHEMAHHSHVMLHAILVASLCSAEDKARLTAATLTLKAQADELSKTVGDNPVPK